MKKSVNSFNNMLQATSNKLLQLDSTSDVQNVGRQNNNNKKTKQSIQLQQQPHQYIPPPPALSNNNPQATMIHSLPQMNNHPFSGSYSIGSQPYPYNINNHNNYNQGPPDAYCNGCSKLFGLKEFATFYQGATICQNCNEKYRNIVKEEKKSCQYHVLMDQWK
eukprot:UN31597